LWNPLTAPDSPGLYEARIGKSKMKCIIGF
jgi:hypothetical protein